MSLTGKIVAYTYRADLWCPDCIVMAFESEAQDAERYLDSLAMRRGINREDERTFDSDEFPKVVSDQMIHDDPPAFCGRCGKALNLAAQAAELLRQENPKWEDDRIQFARLLAEIRAIGLNDQQYIDIGNSMDLMPPEIDEILERAETAWQLIKEESN